VQRRRWLTQMGVCSFHEISIAVSASPLSIRYDRYTPNEAYSSHLRMLKLGRDDLAILSALIEHSVPWLLGLFSPRPTRRALW
jgi:hypothetical protein